MNNEFDGNDETDDGSVYCHDGFTSGTRRPGKTESIGELGCGVGQQLNYC